MSECVVRMPNPDDCNKCAVRFICSPYEDYWQQDTRRKPTPGQKGCRILSVLPEKHGRLVDADALLRDIEKYHVSEGKFQHWLELQPTIVPAEAERSET